MRQWRTTGADGSRFDGTWSAALDQAAWLEEQGIGWRIHALVEPAPEEGESMPKISIAEANREVRASNKERAALP